MSTSDARGERRRRGAARPAFVALIIGFILGVAVMIAITGNPLSSSNEVEYMDVTVGSVSDEEDSLCWSTDPQERDASRRCAILALDPQSTTPSEGDAVTIGLVQIAPPGMESRTQVVYAGPTEAGPTEAGTTEAGLTEPDPTEGATGAAD